MHPILVGLSLSCALSAQTFVVDAAGGPGSNFTDIAAAVAAVPDGATLLVRPGSHGGFAIAGKGIALLAQPGAVVGDAWAGVLGN